MNADIYLAFVVASLSVLGLLVVMVSSCATIRNGNVYQIAQLVQAGWLTIAATVVLLGAGAFFAVAELPLLGLAFAVVAVLYFITYTIINAMARNAYYRIVGP